MVADGEHDPEFDLIVESTGLDLEQVDSLKKGFEGFDKEDFLRRRGLFYFFGKVYSPGKNRSINLDHANYNPRWTR